MHRMALGCLVALVLVAAAPLGTALAKPLSAAELRGMVREDRRTTVRQLTAAGQRHLAGKRLRGYVAVEQGGVTKLYKKGQEHQPGASTAILDAGKVAAVHVPHTRSEKNGDTTLYISYRPDQTLTASARGKNARKSFIFVESGLRSNGDAPGSRHVLRDYTWGGTNKGLISITTDVSENDGNLLRPTSSGKQKNLREQQRGRKGGESVFISYPNGVPAGTPATDLPGQYRFDLDSKTWNTPAHWKKVK